MIGIDTQRTVAAISTPQGIGGISVIRISGEGAIKIGAKIFSSPARIENAPSHTIHYGYIKSADGELIDKVLVTVMRAPRTYTGEDTVEINTHGGMAVTKRVLDECIKAGAYPAQAGEFTKRAFLNGKLDLSEAEAVADIINADSEAQRKNALMQLEGSLSSRINDIRARLITLAAQMQVAIDYPDEELEDVTAEDIARTAEECLSDCEEVLRTADNGTIIKNGIRTVIAGKPNVGKSSLMNRLAGGQRAIVTERAGTTRDVIEEYVDIGGVTLKLADTAGIHETDDEIEKLGVERSRTAIEDADLVLAVIDASSDRDEEDARVLDAVKNRKHIIVANKCDAEITGNIPEDAVTVSAKTGAGIDKLRDRIKDMYDLGELFHSGMPVITNARHKAALENAVRALAHMISALADGMPQDIASIDLSDAADSLGEITGTTVSDDVVAEIFSRFCVGK